MFNPISIIAEYFIFWWITLFMVLPVGLRTQADDNDVAAGTVKSAPAQFRFWRVIGMTTMVSALLYCLWFLAIHVYGISAMSFPRIVPDFSR